MYKKTTHFLRTYIMTDANFCGSTFLNFFLRFLTIFMRKKLEIVLYNALYKHQYSIRYFLPKTE